MEELRLEDAARNPQRSFSLWDLLLYEKVIAEKNLTLLLDTDLVGAQVERRGPERPKSADAARAMKEIDTRQRISSVRAVRQATEDEFLIRAAFYADCTGDGRLGFEAGADFTEGREARTEFDEPLAQPTRDLHRLGSSVMLMARDHGRPMPFHRPEWARHFTREQFTVHRDIRSYEYGYWWFEWGGETDTIKDDALIRHECTRIALGVWDYVKNSGDHPKAANYALDWVAPISGKRESRRFLGTHILTQKDVLNPAARTDAVAYGGWPMDLHPPGGVDASQEAACTQHWFPHLFGIPYGCYHSRNVDNLFFAGRNLSATHVAFASTRVMATCAIGGQAVGTAAALLVRASRTRCAEAAQKGFLSVLRQQLLKDDCFLPGATNEDPKDFARRATLRADSASEPVRRIFSGISRDLQSVWGPWSSNRRQAWSPKGKTGKLTLKWREPIPVREIRLTFDTGLMRELILSGSDPANEHTLRTPQPECVRAYRLYLDGRLIAEVNDNLLRHRIHRFPDAQRGRELTIECLATHGGVPPRVFEVRVY